MIKYFKQFSLLVIVLGFSVFLNSCCEDCFDDLEGSIEIKLNFDYQDTVKHFNPNRLDLLDSMYLLKTKKGDLNSIIDTIYHFEKEYFTRTHLFLLNSDQGFDYILKNREPHIETTITEFSSEVKKGNKRCSCADVESMSFKIDDKKYNSAHPGIIWVYRNK